MKKEIMIAAVILAFIITAIPFTADDDSSDAASAKTYYITGYVVEVLQTENAPLEDVKVSIYSNTVITSDITDSYGFFSVPVNSIENLQIKFDKESYTVRGLPECLTPQEGSDYYLLDLTNITPDEGIYLITTGFTGLHCIIMGSTTGSISGTVSYSGGPVINATVTLVSASTNTKYTLTTDKYGSFYMSSCPTGVYYLSVSCNGFENSETKTVTVSDDTEPQMITLVKTNLSLIFGMDATHFLMTLGVIFGVMTTVSMLLISRRLNSNITIVDDTIQDEDEE